MAKSNFSLADYEAVRAVVERTLPKLNFKNPDHASAGHELLAALNNLGARLEYQKHNGEERLSKQS